MVEKRCWESRRRAASEKDSIRERDPVPVRSQRPRRVAVVGSYNVGETVVVDRLPRPGETLMGGGYSEGPGGKGSNQAVAAGRLGGEVWFLGCVGEDRYGDEALSLWKSEGIATGVKRVGAHTGFALIAVDRSGTNIIVIDPGANLKLTPRDVDAARGSIVGSRVVLTQLEIPVETAVAAGRLGKRLGATTILNPAPSRPMREIDLTAFDMVTPNEEEFGTLTGTKDLEKGTAALLKSGVKTAVVTLGERGAYVATSEVHRLVSAPRVRAVDSTGAGDAFNGALAVAMCEGMELGDAVKFANCAGALTVTKTEVVPALPTRAEVDRLMEAFASKKS
jgi:ribokinase